MVTRMPRWITPKRLEVSLKPLQPGTYNVTWRITSTDTHKTKGSYIFKVVQ
jgi:methionine-rich copper-binding protein CopC